MSEDRRLLPGDGLLLASGSPRRRALLQEAGLAPMVAPVALPERQHPGEGPRELAVRLAAEKAAAALAGESSGQVVLAADTVVVLEGRVMGKPADGEEARRMLQELAGSEHQVLTALALVDRASREMVTEVGSTWLSLRRFSARELDAYLASGSPLDKAGAYGIQDESFEPVEMESFSGCFTNVMGLPLCLLQRGLGTLGWTVEADLAAACFAHVPHAIEAASIEV